MSLAASLKLAFDQLAADDPAALALLGLAAQLAPEPIPFTLFTTSPDRLPPPLAAIVGDPVAFAGITGLLRRRALVRVGPDSLQVHRLVQTILRDSPIRTLDSGDLTTIARQLLRDAVLADPWNNPPSWPAWRQLLPHMLAVTEPARYDHPDSPDIPWLLDRAATYLLARGEPQPARSLDECAHQLYRDILGEEHPDTLRAVNNLALGLSELGDYQRAREFAENTLARRQRVLGEDHPDTLVSANTLAIALSGLDEHERARELIENTLARRQRMLGEDHPETLESANNLAADLHALGEHEKTSELKKWIQSRNRS